MITTIHDFLFHLDSFLYQIVNLYPFLSYFLFFAIVFFETAFIPLTPILPGHGLLIVVGALAARGIVNLQLAIPALILGGILGNMMAYRLGQYFGPSIFGRISWLNQKHYDEAHQFYEQHGSIAFVLSRFVPMVRVLMPFVAGIAQMNYSDFMKGNVLSMIFWVLSLTLVTYYLGHIPFIQQKFITIVIGIAVVGFITLLLAVFRSHFKNKQL
ncbi:MAG: VTT domain-containing protein [Chitinophagales bacterium]